MSLPVFDSRDSRYKSPFGAVACGCAVTFSLRPLSAEGFRECTLVITGEFAGTREEIPLRRAGTEEDRDLFTGLCTAAAQPELMWYCFRFTRGDGSTVWLGKNGYCGEGKSEAWQLTVYDDTHPTPDWFGRGVTYQIFPDRFYRTRIPDPSGMLGSRVVHENWDEEVSWQPTPEGLVLNNDFYGGNFRGITEKLPYIASLGATILYLNPISKSFSSHRYDTGDYKTPDPMLGTTEDFTAMCDAAHQLGIRVILDGVYSHTGDNSLYFDKHRTFGGNGAYSGPDSPYFSWYTFRQFPNNYASWWGFDTLPTVNKMDPNFLEYIITGEDSVVAHWLRLGADGYRLDVADELPDEFIKMLRDRIRQIKPDALLIGEVWEDASVKKAYDRRRTYFTNGELDSVMNYPFRTAIINFMRGFDSGRGFQETVMSIVENYPPQVVACNMNLLGTHDTARILTALVDDFDGSREEKAKRHLSRNDYDLAQERLHMAAFLQYMLPGCPSIYYGDEAGMEGYKDPFNRRPYPWGREDDQLLEHYRCLGQLRKSQDTLRFGDISFFHAEDRRLGFLRSYQGKKLRIYVNRSRNTWDIPVTGKLLFGHNIRTVAPNWLSLHPMGFCVVEVE